MNLNDKATKLQNRLIKDGARKLSKILRRIKLPLDFNRSLEENIFDVNNVFTPISEFLLSYAETVSLNAIEFSKQQLRELPRKKYTVKSTDIEITVNWAMVDQNVISFLRRGDDFTNPYFDIVTQAISNGNRNWLRDEYSSFVLGEKNLKEAYDRLRNGLTGPQRANLIVRTEMTSVWANAQQEAYRSAGTLRNGWETRNDGNKVCPICQPLNGLEAVIGQPFPGTNITKPPSHVGCRCTLSPVPMTDEELEELINGKRKVPETISKIKVKGKVITPPPMPDRPKTTQEFLSSLQKIEDSRDKLHDDLVKEEAKEVKLLRKLAKERDKNKKVWEKNTDTEISETYTKYQESVKEYEKQITKVSKISNDRFNIDNVVRQKQRELLYSDYLSNNQVKYLDPSLKNNPSFQSGMEEFNKLVPDYLLKNKQVEFDLNTNYPFTKNIGTDRSWFSPNNNVVYFNPNADVGAVIHELSHYLDWDNQKVRSMVSTYLSSRTVGEQAVTLDSIYPNRGFAPHEMTKKDRFSDAYMGKEYPSSKGVLTEITSMGLERIWRNPLKFIKDDPDYFEFIMSKVLNRY